MRIVTALAGLLVIVASADARAQRRTAAGGSVTLVVSVADPAGAVSRRPPER